MKRQRRRNENDHCRILPSRHRHYSPDRSCDPMLMKTISSMDASPGAKRLWEKLQDVTINEEAWEIIEDAIKKALTEAGVGSPEGVEGQKAPVASEEWENQRVPIFGSSGWLQDIPQNECPGNIHLPALHAVLEEITDPYERED